MAAYQVGDDGRQVLDPLRGWASELLVAGSTMLVVQSVLSGVKPSLASLWPAWVLMLLPGWIPGPALSARTRGLESLPKLNGASQIGVCRLVEG